MVNGIASASTSMSARISLARVRFCFMVFVLPNKNVWAYEDAHTKKTRGCVIALRNCDSRQDVFLTAQQRALQPALRFGSRAFRRTLLPAAGQCAVTDRVCASIESSLSRSLPVHYNRLSLKIKCVSEKIRIL
jgi:hypothetical protein